MTRSPDSATTSSDGDALLIRIEQALAKAVREALRRHKLAGNPVAVWRDGGVVWVDPREIPGDEVRPPTPG
ncbi:MAG: hypothetical protein R2882_15085 [Gemmatimonadales bacterium]